MTTVHVMRGLPASGKTELARTLLGLRFNLDDLRAMLGITPETWTREQEDVAMQMLLAGAKTAVKAGFTVVLDNTHIVPRIPAMYRKVLGPLGVDWVVHDLTDVPAEECIRRDSERDVPVGESVIRKMNKRRSGWQLTPEWLTPDQRGPLEPYVPDTSLPAAVIVDIDGTVALHGDERGHYEYDKVGADKTNDPVVELVQKLAKECEIIFVSGREDRCRDATEKWLWRAGLREHPELRGGTPPLLMRKTGDHRSDDIIKAELFDRHIRDHYNVRWVLDDRTRVVAMWRELGLACLQVAPGTF